MALFVLTMLPYYLKLFITMKTCLRCNTDKARSEFHKNRRKVDGLDIYCKECNRQRIRDKYHSDQEWRAKKIQSTRQYHLDHPEWSRARLRAHHEAHAEERSRRAILRGRDPKVAASRRDATKRSESKRRAVKAGSTAVHISSEMLEAKLRYYGGKCCICDRVFNEEVPLHWDHVKPLAVGGAHMLANFQPLCAPCNVRKNSVYPLTDERREQIKCAVLAAGTGV